MAELHQILNWRRRDAQFTLSGQPSEEQLADLAATGTRHIINLGPHTNKGALPDEPRTVAALGMTYTYIPVDFAAFKQALADVGTDQTHVHCIYNARVSAFFYRLDPSPRAFELMDGIWRPGGVWANFIDKPEDAGKPNRYAGYDY